MKRTTRLFVLGLLGIVLSSTAAQAKVIWRGDFETGDISQWNGKEIVSADRLQIVTDPVRQGRHALRVKVKQGDDPIRASGNRNELLYTGDMPENGDDRYYAWSTMWPSSYVADDTWQLFTQWHHTGLNGSPPVELFNRAEKIYLRVNGDDLWSAPLERAKWHDFVLHIKWSEDKKVGYVELYYDGKLVLPKTYAATLFKGQSSYLKQGLYRNKTVSQDQTIFHDGMTIATTLDDVMTQGGTTVANNPGSGSGSTQSAVSTSGTNNAVGTEASNVQVAGGGCSSGSASAMAAVVALALVALRRPLGYARRRK